MSQKKTETTSFRFETEMLEQLRKIAKKDRISVNVLVMQILDSYLDWGHTATGAGWAVMPKQFLIDLINSVDEKTVCKLATDSSKSIAKDISLLMRGKYDVDSWLSIIRNRALRSGFYLKEFENSSKIKIVMQHDMGEKWSIYFKSFYENLFHELGIRVEFDVTKHTVALTIDKSVTK